MRTAPQLRPRAHNSLRFPTFRIARRVSSVPRRRESGGVKVWTQAMMAEITDQVPEQESLDEIQHEQQDEEASSIPGQEVVPPEPEFISETLYIQNLNDKVKLSC
jgi:hypothetical protein